MVLWTSAPKRTIHYTILPHGQHLGISHRRMDRHIVSSSVIRSVGYDATKLILEIEFQNGTIYHYFAVPAKVHDSLLSVGSKGRFFDAWIKPNYDCEQVY